MASRVLLINSSKAYAIRACRAEHVRQCHGGLLRCPLLNRSRLTPAPSVASPSRAPHRSLYATPNAGATTPPTPESITNNQTQSRTSGPPPSPPDLQSRKRIRDRLPLTLPRENVYTFPNILTTSRLISAPLIGYLIITEHHLAATLLLAYAGLTDLLDGHLARRYNLHTVVGSVIDPIADKTLMTVLTACLALKGLLPAWLGVLILGRDASLAVAATYYRYASLPDPKTLARYWDFGLPSAEVHPTGISKLNTLLQLLLIGAATAYPLVPASVHEVGVDVGALGEWHVRDLMGSAQGVVAGTTAWSGASYLYTRDAVKILGDGMDEMRKRRVLRRGRGLIAICFAVCAGVAVGFERRLGNGKEGEKKLEEK